MGIKEEQEIDVEEAALKVEDVYGEEIAEKFTNLADVSPDEAFKFLGKLFCGIIPYDEDEEYGEHEDD